MGFDQVIKVIIDNAGVLGLAIFAIWMLNKTWESRLEEAKRYAKEVDEVRRELLDALNRNTAVLSQFCELEK